MKNHVLRKGLCALVVLCAGIAAFAQSPNFSLLYRWSASNPVYVAWNDTAKELSVTYTNWGNYFEMTDTNEAQSSKLYRQTSSGLQEVGGVVTRVVDRRDSRGGTKNYGTLVFKFYQGGSPYQFASGRYAVGFDIVALGYHHGNKTPWEFTVGSSGAGSSYTLPEASAIQKFDYTLLYRWSYSNPVNVTWNDTAKEMTVTYPNSGNYFEMTDINEAQQSKLYRKTSSGLQEVGGVITKVVDRKDSRGGNKNYGTLVLKFYQNGSPYNFASGTYAIGFDIVALGYHHGSKTPLEFTVLGSSSSSTGSTVSTSMGSASNAYLGLTMETGDSIKLSVIGASSTAKWSSSAPSVVKLNDKGRATALSAGSAIITATSGSATVKVKITVED